MYEKIYKNILFPFYETFLRKRNTLVYLKILERNQWLPLDVLKKNQWLKLKKILIHSYNNVSYYRELFNNYSIRPDKINNEDDFRKIPFLTKKNIQNNQDKLMDEFSDTKSIVSNETGGSTGEPIKFSYYRDSYEWRCAAANRSARWAGWDYGKRITKIWGTYFDNSSFKQHVKFNLNNFFRRVQVISAFSLSEFNLQKQIDDINRFKPLVIESYVSSLFTIAQFVKEHKIFIHKPEAIITSAEMLYDYQRKIIENVFECKIFNRYGCCEVSLIGCECEKHQGLHLNIDNVYIEFLRNNKPVSSGHPGEIVLTDLNNFYMPLIRYKVGDVGVVSDAMCSCGRGLPLMEKIEGRTMDILYTEEGNFIQPQIFCFLFSREIDWIKQYQIIQEKKGFIKFKIVSNRCVSDDDKKNFKKIVQNSIKGTISIFVDIVDNIKLTKAGKLRTVISKVS